MQNREIKAKRTTTEVEKRYRYWYVARGGKISFPEEGGGINIIFGPKYRPLFWTGSRSDTEIEKQQVTWMVDTEANEHSSNLTEIIYGILPSFKKIKLSFYFKR
jgi:hypothetical protein